MGDGERCRARGGNLPLCRILLRQLRPAAPGDNGRVPRPLRRPLAEELSPEAFHLMEARSRLDLRLWHDVARKSVQPRYLDNLRDRARLHSVARHAQLMAN